MKTPEEIIKGQAIRYVDSYQVGDGANTLSAAILAALTEEGYKIAVRNPCRCMCGLPTDKHLCPCGCGHTYDDAVSNVMRGPMYLSRDQAEANIDEHPHVPCKWPEAK